MAKLKINDNEFYLAVNALIDSGMSVSNAVKKLAKNPRYSNFNYNQLRSKYYRLQRSNYTPVVEDTEAKKDASKKSFMKSIADFFRNLF